MTHSIELTKKIAKEIQEKLSVKEISGKKTFKVVATSEARDRDGESIKVSGRDFENYMKNPVILANHSYTVENIIGKATSIYQEGDKTIVEGVFSDTNPLGVLVSNLYDEGMLKTVSVGFIARGRDENDRASITKAELLELSFVAVPCNPEALSLDGKLIEEALKKGMIIEKIEDEEEIEEEDEMLNRIKNIEEKISKISDFILQKEQKEIEKQKELDIYKEQQDILKTINKATSNFLQNIKKIK